MLSFDSILLSFLRSSCPVFFIYNAWLVDRMGVYTFVILTFFLFSLISSICNCAEGRRDGEGRKGERERGKEGRQRKEGQNMKYLGAF